MAGRLPAHGPRDADYPGPCYDDRYADGGHQGRGTGGHRARETGGFRDRGTASLRDREPSHHDGRGYPGRGYDDHRGRRTAGYAGRDHDAHYGRDAWGYWDDEEPAGYRTGRPAGGAAGNERLTGLTGMVLLVLFAAEGFTLLAVRQMLTLHFFLGMLIIGPLVLKVCSTMYRFTRYYTGDAEYRRKGPPALLLRLLGPFVILTSVSVIGTGIMLAVAGPGPGRSLWLFAHKAAFVLWFGVMTVHVLAYVWRLPGLVGGDLATRAGHRAEQVLGGRGARWLLLAASLLAGLVLAVLTLHLDGSWLPFATPGT